MRTQLTASGYSLIPIRQDGDGATEQVERNDITTALERAAQEECDLLLVYFTGHGVHVKGKDYLVPANALAPEPGQPWLKSHLDSLLPIDMMSYLEGCRAPSVVYVVDACRDSGPEDASEGFGAATVHAPSQRLALFVGCRRGQQCHYDDAGSYFTRAFTEALDPYAPERTLEAVFHQAKHRTTVHAQRVGEQQPQMNCAPRDEELSGFPELCEGTEIPLRWREDVQKASLWSAGRSETGPDSPMRERIAAFARECAVSVLKDRRRFNDPWNDPGLPTRTVRRVMPVLLPGASERSPVETGLLVALPFLREAMWARKLSRLADAAPFDLDPVLLDGNRSKMRTELQYIHESHPQLLRKARGHKRRGEAEAHKALAAWLAHRWVAEQLVDPPDPGGEELIGRLAMALLGPGREHEEEVEEVRWRLAQSIRFLADDPGDLPSFNQYLRNVPTALTTAEGRQDVHWWSVLGLVRLAGLLAADVRQFPDVLPDHVGVTAPVHPTDVVRTLHDLLDWTRQGNDVHLHMLCPHEAIHECLSDLAVRADTVLRSLHAVREQLRKGFPNPLPGRVTTDLQPRRLPHSGISEEPAYSTPLLRFALAQDEIRELLMGHQLYGDRSLAVRELYQNAADACRYRELRWRYLDRKGDAPAKKPAEIRISQGREPSRSGHPGRAYIECRDNGVGMGRTQLEQTFSRAGRRFAQTRAFRQEQSRWLEEDATLQLYPYSRFGIGVLSYFMIADEVTLVTREVDAEGNLAQQALVVDISSSSGLFRIRGYEGTDDPMREGGTRVRLMLSEPEDNKEHVVSALDVLRHQVRLNEYQLVLSEEGVEPVVWPAGKLRHPAPEDEAAPVPPLDARGPVWWVTGKGMVLADGIVTSEEPFGYVVNLTGPQAPQLSVNRNSLLDWNRKWTTEQVRKAASDLPGWAGLDLEWLWDLERADVPLARAVASELAGLGLMLPVRRSSSYHWPDVSLDTVGWFPEDGGFLPSEPDDRHPPRLRMPGVDPAASWRLAVLRDQGLSFNTDVQNTSVLPEDVTGYPVPRPGDGVLLSHAAGSPRNLVAYSLDSQRSVAEALRELRRFVMVSPRIRVHAVAADETPSLDFVPDPVDTDLVRWMRDWSKPRRAQRQPAAGALISISAARHLPLDELIERCRRFAPLGLEVPDVPTDLVTNHVATIREAELLAGWTEHEHKYCPNGLPKDVLPVHIARLAKQLGLTSAEVLAELQAWQFLGYRLPHDGQLLSSAPSSDQWEQFSDLWDPQGEEPDPTLRHLLVEATQAKMTIDAYLHTAGDLAEQAGVQLPEIHPRTNPLPLLEHSDLKLLGLSQAHSYRLLDLDGADNASLPAQSIPIDFLASCYTGNRIVPDLGTDLEYEAWDVVYSRIQRVAMLGMAVPADLEPLRHWMNLPPRDRVALFIGSLDPTVLWTEATLVRAAGEVGESLALCAKRLVAHEIAFHKTAPNLPAETLSLSPSAAEASLMTNLHGMGSDEPIQVSWAEITPFGLAQYAHNETLTVPEALDQLAPYRQLGALIPQLTGEERALTADLRPNQFDVLALSEDMSVDRPRRPSPFGPLELLAVAGRLGQPVRTVYERLRLYEPLGVVVDVPEAPDTLPLWQDLVLLSEGLNGREPALQGIVTGAQIDALARELDTDREWVAARLHTYSAMFNLQLMEEPTEDDTLWHPAHPQERTS